MNRFSLRSVGAALLIMLGGCSATSTQFDWDQDYQFTPLKTWAWAKQPKGQVPDDLAAQRVVAAVESQLSLQGYQKVEGDPDFEVAWQVRSTERMRVYDSGYYSPYAGGRWTGHYGPRSVDVSYYEEGSLIIDVIEANEQRLVWRGTATRALSNNPSPEKSNEIINDAVAKIFAGFPPKS